MTFERKTLRSLLSVIFIDQTYLTITFPLITLIFFDPQSRLFASDTPLATRSMWYGLCVALPNMINLFFAPTLSALSDELGRKKILLIEIFSAMIFTLCVGLGIYKGQLIWVFLGFIIKGAFSRTNPTALAIIGDITPREKKILHMGYLQFAISVGAFLGPLLGGYFATRFFFHEINFALPFFIAAFIALSNTVFAFFSIQETRRKTEKQPWAHFNLRAFKQVLTHPDVLRISLLLLLIQTSWSTYYQFIPPILKTLYHFDSATLGLFIGMIAFWLAVTTGIGLKLLHQFLSLHQMLLTAAYLVAIGLFITFLACAHYLSDNPLWIWLGAIPTAAGDVIAYSCLTALYSNAVAHEKQGKVMGVGFIVVGSVWATTGFLGGLLMSINPLLPLMVAPITTVIALGLIHQDFGKRLVLSYRAS